LDYAQKYKDKDIWNILPKYFKTIQSQVAYSDQLAPTLPVLGEIRFGLELFVPQKVFIAQFNQHCRENNLETPRFNQDFYAGPFSARELEVRVETKIYKGQAFSTQPFIFGVDFIDTFEN
jgi:hypothetical protein